MSSQPLVVQQIDSGTAEFSIRPQDFTALAPAYLGNVPVSAQQAGCSQSSCSVATTAACMQTALHASDICLRPYNMSSRSFEGPKTKLGMQSLVAHTLTRKHCMLTNVHSHASGWGAGKSAGMSNVAELPCTCTFLASYSCVCSH